MASNQLFSPELEQSILSCLLQFPETYSEISWLNNKDFSKVNAPIFSVIQQIIESKGRPDTVIVAERLKSIGITLDGIDVGTYVETLTSLRSVEPKNVVELAKELKKKTLVRTISENCDKLKREVTQNQEKSGRDIISSVDKYLGDSLLDMTGGEHTGTNLLETLPDDIEAGSNDGSTEMIICPYKNWMRVLSGFRPGEIYANIARRGCGKSMFMMDLARKLQEANTYIQGAVDSCCGVNDDAEIRVLYIDLEMDRHEFSRRLLAGKTGVPYHLLDTHKWRYDAHWSPIVRAELENIRKSPKNIWFEFMGGKSTTALVNFAKAWFLKNVGRVGESIYTDPITGEKKKRKIKPMIFVDYFKIEAGDRQNGQKEYESAQIKSEALKDLAVYCHCPVFFSLQSNIQGITRGKHSDDISEGDGQAAISDRISWNCNYMGILRNRTHDEVMDDSLPNQVAPSHKLIPIKTRNLGIDGPDFLKWLRIKGTGANSKEIKYKQNFLSFNADNFNLTDCDTYDRLLIKQGRLAMPLPTAGVGASPI